MKNLITRRLSIGLTLIWGIFLSACESNDIEKPVDCSTSTLTIAVTSKQDVSSCTASDGMISTEGSGGTAPYQFKLNSGSFVSSGVFINLGPGTYTITIKDTDGCEKEISESIQAANSTLAATSSIAEDNQCLSDNGSFTITASGGTTPYMFQLGSGSFGSASSFTAVKFGSYTVKVMDATGCTITVNVNVPRGDTGTSYSSQVQNIIQTSCTISGCHNGDNGSSINWLNFSNVQTNASNIKLRTQAKSMPPLGQPALTQNQIDLIGCWVDDGAKSN
ncbi:MAG: hypothetical protein HC811_02870 [Flammeovirgaceae bacterium]|nr:hypothetical protein [Flammeovirgaceae bacterium]